MQQFITNYGYLAIFVLMLAESACIPVPSELIMTFGGALAAGAVPGTHLNLIGVILAGTAGNVAGSYIAWAVGRYGGQPLLRRLSEGRLGRHLLREHDLDRAIAWFDRHGGKAVLIGRLLPVVRTFISLPAGIAEMPALRFGIYTTIGCIPWTAALAVAGYAVGTNWESIATRSTVPPTSSPRSCWWSWCWPCGAMRGGARPRRGAKCGPRRGPRGDADGPVSHDHERSLVGPD